MAGARKNMAIYNEVPVGSASRLAGRCEFVPESQQWILQTFEGAKLPVQKPGFADVLPPPFFGIFHHFPIFKAVNPP
jgi:hypothetical protein